MRIKKKSTTTVPTFVIFGRMITKKATFGKMITENKEWKSQLSC